MTMFSSDDASSSVIVNIPYVKGRTEVHQDDITIFALQIFSNKRYIIKMSATARVRIVLVVKVHSKPDLFDLYGGDSISKNATLLVIDFAGNDVLRRAHPHPATGLEYVLKEANDTYVNLVGTLHSKEDKTMLYFAVMPPVYDKVLCKRCTANLNSPCGFCSGKDGTSVEAALDVKVTTVVYAADCVFWSKDKGEWTHDGCEVSEVPLVYVHTTHYINREYEITISGTWTLDRLKNNITIIGENVREIGRKQFNQYFLLAKSIKVYSLNVEWINWDKCC